MKRLTLLALTAFFPYQAVASGEEIKTAEFDELSELGRVSKPTSAMKTASAAFNFIVADKIVRKAVANKIEQGYKDWEVTAKRLGYDGNEPIYEVRVTSSTQLPPYSCVFRFDSVGNDRREHPWKGCQYE